MARVLTISVVLAISTLLSTREATAQQKVKVTTELRNCTSVEASAIFGGRIDGCLIYDVTNGTAEMTASVCTGLMVGVGGKLVFGGEVKNEKVACLSIKTETKDTKSAADVKALLESKSSEELRKEILKSVQKELEKLPDSKLKEYGLDRKKLKGLKDVQFKGVKDATKDKESIQKSLENCPVDGSKDVT